MTSNLELYESYDKNGFGTWPRRAKGSRPEKDTRQQPSRMPNTLEKEDHLCTIIRVKLNRTADDLVVFEFLTNDT